MHRAVGPREDERRRRALDGLREVRLQVPVDIATEYFVAPVERRRRDDEEPDDEG
jgi:hypothetical protein